MSLETKDICEALQTSYQSLVLRGKLKHIQKTQFKLEQENHHSNSSISSF
jgi:hypothetical protein